MDRLTMVKKLFPKKIEKLWCPILTHYTDNNEIDFDRITKHIDYIKPNCASYLIPGSTGDAWELSEAEIDSLIEFALKNANASGFSLLIGVLEKDAKTTLKIINKRMKTIKNIAGTTDVYEAFERTGVKGFVVCPPTDIKDQDEVYSQLESILKCDLPICLYQLPQVTNSEMTPETVLKLSKKYPNFFMLKDSSGEDKIANANITYNDIFLVRGAEGNYAENMKEMGGCYDGFLLSTVNSFPQALGDFVKAIQDSELTKAKKLSDTIGKAIEDGFSLVANITAGNAFANANKCFDYWNAFGENGDTANLPMLHAGIRIGVEKLNTAREILREADMLSSVGYVNKD